MHAENIETKLLFLKGKVCRGLVENVALNKYSC